MRILITGASGFVGRHLEKLLEISGYEFYHLVRNKKGFYNEFIWDFKGPLPEGIPVCDVIVHLAAYVDFSSNLDIDQYKVNTVSTLRLAAHAKEHGAYFIFASTAGVHGTQYPLITKDTPIAPENHYAMSKYLAEEQLKALGVNHSILRIGGVYGLDGAPHLGLNKAISDAVYRNEPPVLRGTGKAKRNYICVLDVAQWIESLTRRYGHEKGNIEETLYLCSTEIMTIEEYLQAISDIVLKNGEIIRTEGADAMDMIINPSKPPFSLRTFRGYLESLI